MRSLGAASLASFMVTACMTVPELPNESLISVEAVVKRVKCELWYATEKHQWLRGDDQGKGAWVGNIDLTLEITHKASAAGNLAFVVPVHTGTFTLGFTGGPTETARRAVSVSFPIKLRTLGQEAGCARPHESSDRTLQGDLGIVEWIDRVASTVGKPPATGRGVSLAARRPKGEKGKDKSIGYTLEFVLLVEGSVTPSFKLVPAKGHERTGSVKVAGSRDNTHQLDIALTPDTAGADNRLGQTKQDLMLRSLRRAP